MIYNQKTKNFYIQQQLEWNPDADPQVIGFIANFVWHKVHNQDEYEMLRALFMDGYCYYFAHMLQQAFQRGKVCICAPFGHFVWMDDDIPYDIEGVSTSEAEYYIPEHYLGETVQDFLQIPNIVHRTTEDEIQQIMDDYKNDNNI